MRKTINQIIVKFMKFLGIKYCFGVPGSNMSLLDEINKSKKIKLILAKHEEGAGFMASGYSKSTGLPCSCFGSVGPGATNLVTSIAAAYYDSQPILVLSGQVSSSLKGRASFQESTGIGRTISQLKIFKEITGYAEVIEDEKKIIQILKKVYFTLNDHRPSPAYLEIPADVMQKEIDFEDNLFELFEKENKIRLKREIPIEKIKKISLELQKSKKPAILLGGGAIKHREAILKFINKSKIPVLTTLKGRGIISDDHKLSLGTIGLTGQKSANEYIKSGVDFLIVIGSSLSQFSTNNWSFNFHNTKIVRIDIKSRDITKNYKIDYLLQGDISEIISKLELTIKKQKKDYSGLIKKYRSKGYFNYPEMKANSTPLKPQTFIAELRKILPKDSIVCTESIAWVQRYFKIYKPRTQIVCTGFAPIGCSLGEAIGSKMGNKDRVVVSIQGDGGFQMTAMELMTASNYKIPIMAIVLNNGILGPIYHSQIKKYGKSFMTEFTNPSFDKLAESFNIRYYKISNKSEIKKQINKGLKSLKEKHPVLIEVMVAKEKWN